MGHIRQEDQGFLRRRLLLAPPFELETGLVGLELGFAGAALVVVRHDVGQGPVQDGADEGGVLDLIAGGVPAYHQVLGRLDVLIGVDGRGNPTSWPNRLPGRLDDAAGIGWGSLPRLAFGQHLPVGLQRRVDVGITAKASVRAEDGALFLLRGEA